MSNYRKQEEAYEAWLASKTVPELQEMVEHAWEAVEDSDEPHLLARAARRIEAALDWALRNQRLSATASCGTLTMRDIEDTLGCIV